MKRNSQKRVVKKLTQEEEKEIQPILGQRVKMKLEEHNFENEFSATISRSTVKGDETWYVIEPDKSAQTRLHVTHLLFHPESATFNRGFRSQSKKDLNRGVIYSYTPSLEDLLLNPQSVYEAITGRVAVIAETSESHPGAADDREFRIISYGRIMRS